MVALLSIGTFLPACCTGGTVGSTLMSYSLLREPSLSNESEEVLYTADLDWTRFVVNGVLIWPGNILRCCGCYNVLWILVTLEMALRIDVLSFLILLWLVVLTFWQKTWYFTLGGCCGPGMRATIMVIVIRKYFTLGGCVAPGRLYGLATLYPHSSIAVNLKWMRFLAFLETDATCLLIFGALFLHRIFTRLSHIAVAWLIRILASSLSTT